MNSESKAAYKRDLHPKEFIIIVMVGSVASAILSWLAVPALVSVLVAVCIMVALAAKRWQIAKENDRDYQSLEAFAEDLYLLGYLLTLASLLGLAPRLMTDEANLFHIAGLKLVTTVLGLALMMVFRQTARRWAEQKNDDELEDYERREASFRDAVGRMNESTGRLVAKVDEVVNWFDPKMVESVAEWSNKAAGAFAVATTNLESVPGAILTSMRQMQALVDELGRVKNAAGEVASILTAGTAQAANVLATELQNATQATSGLSSTITALTPVTEMANSTLEKFGGQAAKGAVDLEQLGETFRRTALEIAKAERALKKLADVEIKDVDSPMNRLASALELAAETTNTAGASMNVLTVAIEKSAVTAHASAKGVNELAGKMDSAEAVGNALVGRIEVELSKPLLNQQQALREIGGQLATAVERIAEVGQRLENATAKEKERFTLEKDLLVQLGGLQKEMGETNRHFKTLIDRIEGAAMHENKSGFLGRIFGGGSSSAKNP